MFAEARPDIGSEAPKILLIVGTRPRRAIPSQPHNHHSGAYPQASLATALANDPFSMTASIILFPLIIDVVQMTIFLRPRRVVLVLREDCVGQAQSHPLPASR